MERIHSSSNGLTLIFRDKESHKKYEFSKWVLDIQTYEEHRREYGIWASNQGRYVRSISDLNDFDSTHMEEQYARYKRIVGGLE